MKCGAPASTHRRKKFSWYPPWVAVLLLAGALPFIIVAVIMTKRRTLDVPLCAAHKGHWMMRQVLVLCSLFALLGLGILSLVVVASVNDPRQSDKVFGWVCSGWVVLMIGWVIGAAIVQNTTIRPNEITDSSITLVRVAPQFVEAYEEEYRVSPERLDEIASERWERGRRKRRSARPFVEESEHVQGIEDDDDPPPASYRKKRP